MQNSNTKYTSLIFLISLCHLSPQREPTSLLFSTNAYKAQLSACQMVKIAQI